MPFDGTEAKFVKPEVFSLEGLVAWLETKDPAAGYSWVGCDGKCLFDQYAAFCGTTYLDLTRQLAINLGLPVPCEPTDIAFGAPRTFGAALKRARQLLATA